MKSMWCHTCRTNTSQHGWRIDLNNNRHAAFNYVFNYVTLPTDLVHMVDIVQIACRTSWRSMRRSRMRNDKQFDQYLPKTSELLYMPSIAGLKRWNVIGQHYFSLTYHTQQLIRHWEVTKFLDGNDNTHKRNNESPNSVYSSLHTLIGCTKAVSIQLMWASPEGQQL
jgi:hypothetical protein